ncbi:MAG: hypothetical protein IJO39_03360 [Clostridia bacterium]|nr:hypothetical protein [Clostridia bacterium]
MNMERIIALTAFEQRKNKTAAGDFADCCSFSSNLQMRENMSALSSNFSEGKGSTSCYSMFR